MLTPPALVGRAAARAAALAADRARAWGAASQQGARRNAMVAATACAQRRAERQDVADYLARHRPAATSPVSHRLDRAVEA